MALDLCRGEVRVVDERDAQVLTVEDVALVPAHDRDVADPDRVQVPGRGHGPLFFVLAKPGPILAFAPILDVPRTQGDRRGDGRRESKSRNVPPK